jgi:hypothetical protein
MRLGRTHVEVDSRSTVTAYGGLVLVAALLSKLKVAAVINSTVKVLKMHLPYHESDHVIALALNLYVGGRCLEDQANLQQSEAVRRLLKASRIPDPTTAGDFLRRFSEDANPGSCRSLRQANDTIQDRAWKEIAREKRRQSKESEPRWTAVDLDGKLRELKGTQKEGADFSHKGTWSYHPLVVSLSDTGEVLAMRNRPGNQRSSNGAAEVLDAVLPRVKAAHGPWILVRGDADFDRADLREACERAGTFFAVVAKGYSNRVEIAESLPEEAWTPFETRAARHQAQKEKNRAYRRRRKKKNLKRERATERNYTELRQTRQWVAEVPFSPPDTDKTYRLVLRRKETEHHQGQQHIFDQDRYGWVLTNLPESIPPEDVIDATYQRCDQENIVEQLGSGVAAWRMPVAEFAGNCAWLEIARLAWNLGKWIAQLALPAEVVRWKWKRFRHAFVTVPAKVVKRSQQIWIQFAGSHRFVNDLVSAHTRLQT